MNIFPHHESSRLKALADYQVLDTESEQSYDSVTYIASVICEAPISFITLIDRDRQWFKSAFGVTVKETPRELAFCNHTIMQDTPLIVPDLQCDERFSGNALVKGDPHIRFYAGAPLINAEGFALGSVCVVDLQPRQMRDNQVKALTALAHQVMAQLELRRAARKLVEEMSKVKTLQGLLPICSFCKGIRDDKGYWMRVEEYLTRQTGANFSHGVCKPCAYKHYPDFAHLLDKVEDCPKDSTITAN